MDEYLEDEVEWIKNVLDKMCKAWDTKASYTRSDRICSSTVSSPDVSCESDGQRYYNAADASSDILVFSQP
jgi:hypothetical protein